LPFIFKKIEAINQINDISGAIASAVEEQSATTAEMKHTSKIVSKMSGTLHNLLRKLKY
jgi:methyl-accepting chemotaxis protein